MFANRIAVVTGGGSGIGRSLCKILANEKASLVIADQNLAGAEDTLKNCQNPNQHVAVTCDVSKEDSVRAVFDEVKSKYGDKEVASLVANCAGITKDGWITKMPLEQFKSVIDVNLIGTFLTTQIACQRMIEQKKPGSIVNIASVSGRFGNMGQSNYVASKAAVEAFCKTAAREMGKYGIRCNTIVPGYIETPMVESVPEELVGMMMMVTPLARPGTPEEAAEAIAFLLSEKSSYITGTSIMVSGGFGI